MDYHEKAVLCRLHAIKGLGNASLWRIKKEFGSFRAFWTADKRILYNSFLRNELIDEIVSLRNSNPCKYLEYLDAQGIKIITVEEELYSPMLLNISNPPYILYCLGKTELMSKFALAIVGARNATPYGRKIARNFAGELSKRGIVIVSGMARGIDAEAHLGVLEAGGETIAVLGSGINIIYPRENREIFKKLIKKGLIISEFPLNTPPDSGNFPQRNRVISGMSHGVLIVEAKIRSGALITADLALEQGRDVFSVPGPITSKMSEGCHNLIKQGAKLTTCVEDILEEYSFVYKPQKAKNLSEEDLLLLDSDEILILQYMGYEPCHIDDLVNMIGLDVGNLSMILLQLELKGLIKAMPGNYYLRN
ncbi:DNA-processing protein DprA [Thermosyntropha sp.]|uniref:DNA-processing protein DprA n=1 Tax=Thermosyntropha sp. TaxID=2740820 RepID=UPI0025F75E9A|nr:DNA-processing protein DprA [Thermosyntropha sp.]MBO8159336.1 DNA-protecting protein DprA [Thermosyntropha sp.]